MNDILDNNSFSNETNLSVSKNIKNSLLTACTWAKVLSIIQIVFIGLALIMGVIALIASPIIGLLTLAIYGFMMYTAVTLLQFGQKAMNGLNSTNQREFENGIEKLGLWFKMVGVITIVVIALYIVSIIIIGTSGAMMFNRF